MTQRVALLFIALSLSANVSSAGSEDSLRWKAMRGMKRIIDDAIVKARAEGREPKDVQITVVTNLSFLDIVVSAYLKPASEESAKAIAQDPSARVLAKALLEVNAALDPIRGSHACLLETCAISRSVTLPLDSRGLGIVDAPIKIRITYQAKLLHTSGD